MKIWKKMSRKLKIILTIVVLLVATISGFGAYFISELNKAPATIEESEAKFQTTLKAAPNDGLDPTEHSATDVIAYILYNVENTSEFKVITTGKANASIAVQEISNTRIVKDNKAMVSTISSGMVSLGKQRYFEDNKVLIRDYAKLDGIKATWKEEVPECITYKENISRYGWLPFQANGYVICDETYLNKDEIKVEKLSDGLYKVAFDLNPDGDYAPFWYKREILTNSSSTIIPEFISIHAEFTFDKDYRMIYQDFKESYKVKSMGVEAVTNTDVRDEFSYDNVDFDQEFLAFFNQYKDLKPKDFNGEEIEIKEDIASILISSLQNGNSDVLFDIALDINGNKLDGKAALNISDLNDIKVKAILDQLTVEFLSNNLYVSLGNLKIKGSVSDLTDLISPFMGSSDSTSEALDVNAILSQLNSAEVVEDENNLSLSTTLSIMSIDINLNANISKADSKYTLLDASVDLEVSGNKISLALTKGTTEFTDKNYDDYSEIKNLKFIIDFVSSVLENKNLGLDAKVEYNDLLVTLSGDISFDEDINVNADIVLKYKDIELNINVQYMNSSIYFNYGNIHFKAPLVDIISLVSANTNEVITLKEIDINKVLDIVLNINYEELIEKFVLDESSLDISVNLNQFLESLNTISLYIKNEEGLSVDIIYDMISANIKFRDYVAKESKDYDYLTLKDISYIINDCIAITRSNKLNAKINAKYNDIEFNIDAYVDFSNDIKAKLLINALNMDFTLYYFNDTKTVYIEFKDVYAKLEIDSLLSSLNVEMSTPSIDDILSILSKVNLEKVISYLGNVKNTTVVGIDLSQFNIDTKGIIDLNDVIYINLSDTKDGFKVKIDKLFNLSIDILTSFDSEIAIAEKEYIDLKPYIDNVLTLVNTTKYDITLSGNYNDIALKANGVFDREALALKLNLNITYKTNSFDIALSYFHNDNDKFYIDFKDLHAYISLDDIKSYIPVSTDSININDILNVILSKDLNKIIEKLTLTNDKLSIGLNLSDFNIDTMGLIDLSNTINIDLIKLEEGFGLSVSELFNLYAEVTPSTDEVELSDYAYFNLNGFIKNVIDLVNSTKYEIALSGSYKDINLTVNGLLDRETLSVSANISLSYKNNKFDIDVYFIDNTFYVDFNDLHAYISLDDIKSYIPVSTDSVDIESILNTVLSKDLNKILEKILLEEDKLSIGINLSDFNIDTKGFIDLTNTINIELVKLESGFGLSVKELFDLNANIKETTKEVVLPNNTYIDLNSYIENIIDLVNSTKYEITLSGSYKDINLKANGLFDRETLSVALDLELSYKNNTFNINAYFINNIIYLDFKDLHAYLTVDNLKSYIPVNTDSFDVNNILNTILSKDLAKILNKLSLIEDKLSLGLDLSEFNIDTKGLVDLSNIINIDLIKLESGFGLGVKELFDLYAEIKPTDKGVELTGNNYVNLNSYIENVMELVNSTKYEITLAGSYKDITLKANGLFDRETLSVALNAELSYKNNTFNIDVYFIDNIFYVDFKDLHAYISLDDIKTYLPINTDSVDIESILNTILSKDLNKILEAISLTDTKLSLGINLSQFDIDTKGLIDLTNTINIDLIKLESGFGVSVVELFNVYAEIKPTENNIVKPNNEYVNLNSYIKNVIDLVNSTKYDITLSGSYKDIKLDVKGIFDREELALALDIELSYKTNSFNLNVYYSHKSDDTFYIDFMDLHACIKLEDIMSVIPASGNVNIESILDTILSKDLAKILNKLSLSDDKLSLGLDLSDFNIDTKGLVDLANIINIDLVKLDLGFGLNVPELFDLSAVIKSTEDEVVIPTNSYVDLKPYIDLVMELIDSTKYEIELSGSYKDITLVANGVFDREDLSIALEVEVSYKTNKFNLNINYFHEKDNLKDVFYISFMDLHAYVTLEDIMVLIPNASESVSVDSILDTILSKDLTKILESLALTEDKIDLGINLSDLNIDTKGIIDLTNTINFELEKINSGVHASIAELFNLDVVFTTTDKEVELTDYNYINLDSYLDLVKELMDSTKYEIELTGSYKDINIKANGVFDREDLSLQLDLEVSYKTNKFNINVNYFHEKNNLKDVFYISFMDLHAYATLEDIMVLIPNTSESVSVDSILDTILSKDLNKILEKLKLTDDTIGLGINLSDLNIDTKGIVDLTNTINVELKKIQSGVQVSISELFGLELSLKESDKEVALSDYNYINLDSYLTLVKELMDSTKYELTLSGSYKDININASGVFDREELALRLDLVVTYKNNTFDITLNYYHEKDNLKDVFYISFKGLNAYITLEDIMSAIPNASSTVSMDSILDTILSKDLNKILESLTLTDEAIGLGINLSDLNIDTKGIIDLTNTINVELKKIQSGAQVSVSELFGLVVELKTSDKEVTLEDKNYINLSSLASKVGSIINIVNKNSFRLNIDASANISSLVSLLSKDAVITGYVDFLYNDNYSINANLAVKYDNISASINVKYADKYVYLKMLGIDIKLLVDDLKSLVEEVMTKFELDEDNINVENTELLDKVFDVVNTIALTSEDSISLDLSLLLDKLSLITVTLLENNSKYSLDINMNILDCTVSLDEVDYYDLEFNDDYLEYDDILNLCDMVVKILDIAKNKEFNLRLDFTVYDSGVKHLDVEGNLKFKIYDNGKFDMEASGTIKQYEKGQTKYHILDLKLISKEYFGTEDAEDMVYITYGTIQNSSSKIKVYMPLAKVLGMAGTVSSLLGVDLSFLDGYSSFNFNDIDTSQVKNLISSNTEGKNINLDHVIKSFNALTGRLELGLSIGDFLAQPEGNTVSLVVDTNNNGNVIAYLSLHNLYTVYHSVGDSTMFNIDEISLIDESVNITKPNTSGYYDLSDLDKLVNGLITTATFKDFEISGTAKLKMLGLSLISLPIDIKVNVDENGKPIIHAYIDASSYLAKTAFETKYLNIYYKDGFVYIKKLLRKGLFDSDGDTYYLKVSEQTFLDDILYYLLEFGLTATSMVMNNVNNDDGNSNHVIDAGNVLNNYSYSNNQFNLGLDLEELTGNSMLGDVSLSLGLSNVITNEETGEKSLALTSIKNVDLSLLGFIDLTIDSMSLKNIDSNGKVKSVDMSALNNYINGYTKELDVIYKNNTKSSTISHKITFITGFGMDDKVVTGNTGNTISFPAMSNITYEGVEYKFIGWYSDKDLTEEFTLTKFDDDNHNVYARYERV